MDNLWGVVVGAVLTGLVGFVSLSLNHQREQERWLKNAKLQAYTKTHREYEGLALVLADAAPPTQKAVDRLESWLEESRSSDVMLLAPRVIRDATRTLMRAAEAHLQVLTDEDKSKAAHRDFMKALEELTALMREDLESVDDIATAKRKTVGRMSRPRRSRPSEGG